MSFIQIPGNVKQQLLPFVIDPNSSINKVYSSSPGLERATPQYFTYKNRDQQKSGTAKIRFYPSSLDDIKIKDDISYKLLYPHDEYYYSGKEYTNDVSRSITVSDILNTIPGIQIREFLPDTRLDQCINWFTGLTEEFSKLFKKKEGSGDASGKNASSQKKKSSEIDIGLLMKKIKQVSTYAIQYMTGNVDPDYYYDLNVNANAPFTLYDSNVYKDSKGYKDGKYPPGYYIMTFPYTLYYRLQSCVTTNIYEVPAAMGDKRVISSTGNAGWEGGDDPMSTGEMRFSNLLGQIPLIGNLANMLLGNIGINYMPWWNAIQGSKTKEPSVDITFDLFNDSEEAAINNFIFINTIVPNNKWVQYNMFQHSSALYDVKIEGLHRLFACSGAFTVTYEGVLRELRQSTIDIIANKHLNKYMNKESFKSLVKKNKLIKIPDVYKVKLSFQSLLPANFNNYIFQYSENNNHIESYKDHAYDPSYLASDVPRALGKFFKRVKTVWDNPNDTTFSKAATAVPDDNKKG